MLTTDQLEALARLHGVYLQESMQPFTGFAVFTRDGTLLGHTNEDELWNLVPRLVTARTVAMRNRVEEFREMGIHVLETSDSSHFIAVASFNKWLRKHPAARARYVAKQEQATIQLHKQRHG